MLIPISKDSNGIQEWGMVELQGDLETAVEKSGAHIGNITFTKVLCIVALATCHLTCGSSTGKRAGLGDRQ